MAISSSLLGSIVVSLYIVVISSQRYNSISQFRQEDFIVVNTPHKEPKVLFGSSRGNICYIICICLKRNYKVAGRKIQIKYKAKGTIINQTRLIHER